MIMSTSSLLRVYHSFIWGDLSWTTMHSVTIFLPLITGHNAPWYLGTFLFSSNSNPIYTKMLTARPCLLQADLTLTAWTWTISENINIRQSHSKMMNGFRVETKTRALCNLQNTKHPPLSTNEWLSLLYPLQLYIHYRDKIYWDENS